MSLPPHSQLPHQLPDLHLSQHLIVFTRYPVPGTTKTRLIPALGAEAAADLQRQMTEHTLRQVARWQTCSGAPLLHRTVDVRFSGGDRSQMEAWLGASWPYTSQGEGDLGDRLQRAFADSFAAGADQVVAMGIDCPQLTAQQLEQAMQALADHDLVLGPATDGGYYLLGLRRPCPEVFQEIAWSTDKVLQQTLAIAQGQNLRVATLAPLSDIDYPEDLPTWYAVRDRSEPAKTKTLSVIIPALNEAATLPSVLQAVQSGDVVEVIMVDGGSQDDTLAIARQQGAIVLQADPGRARQMNQGARLATGDLLLFLHADTHLPPQFDAEIRHILSDPTVAAGAFTLAIDAPGVALRWVERGVSWRSRWGLPYGDQGLFLRAETFQQVGGFPDQPLLEDVALVRRLRSLGRIAIAPQSVLTSGRRWQRLGVVRTTVLNQVIVLGYMAGISPDRLARWYRGRGRSQSN